MDRGRLSPCPFLPRRFNTGRGRVMAFWKSGSPGIHAGKPPPPPPQGSAFPLPDERGDPATTRGHRRGRDLHDDVAVLPQTMNAAAFLPEEPFAGSFVDDEAAATLRHHRWSTMERSISTRTGRKFHASTFSAPIHRLSGGDQSTRGRREEPRRNDGSTRPPTVTGSVCWRARATLKPAAGPRRSMPGQADRVVTLSAAARGIRRPAARVSSDRREAAVTAPARTRTDRHLHRYGFTLSLAGESHHRHTNLLASSGREMMPLQRAGPLPSSVRRTKLVFRSEQSSSFFSHKISSPSQTEPSQRTQSTGDGPRPTSRRCAGRASFALQNED